MKKLVYKKSFIFSYLQRFCCSTDVKKISRTSQLKVSR